MSGTITLKELITTDIIKNIIKYTNIFIYSYEPENLIMLKEKFNKNIFTFLLNTYLFCFKDLVKNSEEYNNVNNIQIYFETEKQKNNIYKNSPYIINSEINFISTNIFSYNYLYYVINSKNIDS